MSDPAEERADAAPALPSDPDGAGAGAPSLPPSLAPGPRRRRAGVWLLLSLPVMALAAVFAFLVFSHRPIAAPDWLVARIETRANAALSGKLSIALSGGIDMVVDEGFLPRVRLKTVQIARPNGAPLAVLPELRFSLWVEPLLRGQVQVRSFRIRGASLALRRLADGRIDLDLGGGGAMADLPLDSPQAAAAALETALAAPALARLERVTAEDTRIRLDDVQAARVWEVSAGRFALTQDAEEIAATLSFDVGAQNALPAQVALSATTRKGGPGLTYGAAVNGVPARDLALASPALAALSLLDAPISGSLRSGVDDEGASQPLEARLEIGEGAISPAEGAAPVPFEGAGVRLSYDPASDRVAFSDLSFQSRALRLRADGQTLLRDLDGLRPGTLITQIAITDLALDPEGVFERPARFSQGAADLRLHLDPFRVELGQLQLIEGERRITGRGAVSADAEGWRVALDLGVNRTGKDDLLALWPPKLVEPTRKWVAENIATGELTNVRAALRLAPGQEPRLALNYEFRGAEVTALRSLPPVREGRGFATIHDNRHALMVEEGHVVPPAGGQIEVADTTITVPDIRVKFAPMVVRLMTRSPIRAALSLLDEPPFEFLKKAGKGTDIAEGWAEAETELNFRLTPKIAPEDVDFDVRARLTEVSSDKIVPGQRIEAPALRLTADRTGMVLSGKGQMAGVTFDARWSQRFAPEAKGISTLDGYVNVTPAGLEAFNIALPKGAVAGSGWGHLRLDLRADQPPGYFFESDLKGLALKVPEIGWSKPAATKGNVKLTGRLGSPPTVEALSLTAPGLAAAGDLTLGKAGLERARLSSLTIGGWFKGALDLVGRGGRSPDIELKGGRFDLGKMSLGRGGGVGAGGAGGSRISGRLDRVQVTDTIALQRFSGNFTTRGGFQGEFAGAVNGGAAVEGVIAPAANGRPAVRISGADAGAVLAASGIFDKARGGRLDLTLSPVGASSYEGTASSTALRVKDAPVLASLLSAASVVGLLEQLNGEGILFTSVEGAFRLTPGGVSVTRGEAIGASMGVTMTGNYYPEAGRLDMQGVISPFYLVNGIGQVLTRKGEGLFGFTYRLGGSAARPEISVNPFSLLTPGMFREIFRREPPVLQAE